MSLQRIAEISNVSVATVSRVINGRSGPSHKTVTIVHEAMDKIGYTPLPPAMRGGRPIQKNISGIKTGLFATMLFGFDLAISDSPYTDLIRAISLEFASYGYTMILEYVADESKIPAIVSKSSVDGLLCMGSMNFDPRVVSQYQKNPTVWAMHGYGGWGDHVLPDSELIGRQAAEYMLSRGHTNLASMSGVKLERDDLFALRSNSFKAFAESYNANVKSFSTDYIYPERFAHDKADFTRSVHAVYDGFMKEFLEMDMKPTGICVPSDYEAAILYKFLRDYGFTPGKDVEVVGCNNSAEILSTLDYKPATFDLQIDVVAKRVVEQLLWRVDNFRTEGKTKIMIDPVLINNDK